MDEIIAALKDLNKMYKLSIKLGFAESAYALAKAIAGLNGQLNELKGDTF
jgi:hypothetical protein